jgi:hypothetical protein
VATRQALPPAERYGNQSSSQQMGTEIRQ